ncbi:MAG: hypothetical protein WC654_02590 [Patescibacteria group bacterium]
MKKSKKNHTWNEKGGRAAVTSFLQRLTEEAVEIDRLILLSLHRGRMPRSAEADRREFEFEQKRQVKQRLTYLKKKKLVREKKAQGRLLVELTDKGKKELLQRTMCERPKLPGDQVCLVAYDVPVTSSVGRDGFRYFLRSAGFIRVQKSLWQSDRDVQQDVKRFIKKVGIEDWVVVFLAKRQ